MTYIKPEDWNPQGVKELEKNAQTALENNDECQLVTAGAGSGKTEFLAQKAAYLLQTNICPDPKRILAISFKRDAARNLEIRVEKRCGFNLARRFNSYTFDAFTKNLIDRYYRLIPKDFRPSSDYQIVFPNDRELELFLSSNNFRDIGVGEFKQLISRKPLPLDDNSKESNLLLKYWQKQCTGYSEVNLTFQMINRLALFLIQRNQVVCRAIQITYPVVFIDEFQDTTYEQYELLYELFGKSNSVITAVGDDKQRIMLWAGAMPNAFDQFKNDFGASQIPLVSNWRSHEELVKIQHVIANRIDPKSKKPNALGSKTIDGDIAAIWNFKNDDQAAKIIASRISSEVSSGIIKPDEIAILVRKKVDDIEEILKDAFLSQNLKLRNLARDIGKISVQDVLAEELTKIVIPILRLGSGTRDFNNWENTQKNLSRLNGADSQDIQAQQRNQQKLKKFLGVLKDVMKTNLPDEHNSEKVANLVLDFVNRSMLRFAFPVYKREQDFNRVWNGFLTLLKQSVNIGNSWENMLDSFEGIDQVPLMTIHKSKGLEFHTVVFLGLESGTWKNLYYEDVEEINSFFVAFTRARQRAFFALCRNRGQPIDWLEDLLAPVGLNRIDGELLVTKNN